MLPSADPSELATEEGRVQLHALGHVVLKVRSLESSEDFYAGLLGLRVVSRLAEPPMTFLALKSSNNHHDFALVEVGSLAPLPAHDATGLAHVAFKVGTSSEEFGLTRRLLEMSEHAILYEAERGFSRSVHVLDPDGNEVELYVDRVEA